MDPTASQTQQATSPARSGDGDLDLDLLEWLWSLSPAERLARHEQARELVEALRKAGERLYGFDPRTLTPSR